MNHFFHNGLFDNTVYLFPVLAGVVLQRMYRNVEVFTQKTLLSYVHFYRLFTNNHQTF